METQKKAERLDFDELFFFWVKISNLLDYSKMMMMMITTRTEKAKKQLNDIFRKHTEMVKR